MTILKEEMTMLASLLFFYLFSFLLYNTGYICSNMLYKYALSILINIL